MNLVADFSSHIISIYSAFAEKWNHNAPGSEVLSFKSMNTDQIAFLFLLSKGKNFLCFYNLLLKPLWVNLMIN